MKEMLKKFMADESGPTLLEYVALAVLLIIAIWWAVSSLSNTVGDRVQNMEGKFRSYN